MTRYSHRPTVSGKQAAYGFAAAVIAAGLISGAHQHTGHHVADASTMAITSPSGGWTPETWARAFLRSAGLPRTACNRGAVQAWESAEGGAWQNSAASNPLNTTMPEPGSWVVNGDGVRAYVSWSSGLRATVATLRNGDYPGVVTALEDGRNAQAVANAVARSPWGTGSFQASC